MAVHNRDRFAKTLLRAVCSLAIYGWSCLAADAGQPPSPGLSLEPATFDLNTARDRQQLVVTGVFGSEDIRDVTAEAQFESSAPNVVVIEGSLAKPAGNGTAVITARLGDLSATAQVTRASARMNAARSEGTAGSTGRYAAPAFNTASHATAMSDALRRATATTLPVATPLARNCPARRLAAASSPA